MDWLSLSDCLWNWGGIILSLIVICRVVEWDTRIRIEDEIMEEEGI